MEYEGERKNRKERKWEKKKAKFVGIKTYNLYKEFR